MLYYASFTPDLVSDKAIFVLKGDVKLTLVTEVYLTMVYTGCFLLKHFSAAANLRKFPGSFTQTKVVTTSFKATRPQKLVAIVMIGLLDMNRHYCPLNSLIRPSRLSQHLPSSCFY